MDNNRFDNVNLRAMQDEDEITIDLREVFFALKRKLFLIILACIAGGGIALAITMFLMTPIYTSTASLLVLSKETTLTSIADIQLGTQLTNDYKVLIRSTSVLEEVIDDLHLDTTPEELKSTISINNPDGTRLLDISVNNSDPEMARDIVNSIASVSSAFIGDKMEVVPPKIIERGKVPEKQTSPSKKRNTLIGILLGLLSGQVASHIILSSLERVELQMIRGPIPEAYLFSALITLFFAIVVNLIALRRIRRLNFRDAL